MSSSYRAFSSKKDTDSLRRVTNARVVSIHSISKHVLATLAATLIVSGDASLYTGPRPAVGSKQHMSYDEARKQWFDRANSKLAVSDQDDPSQVGAFIASAGVDCDHNEIVFDVDQEMRFDRNVRSMRVRAECVIEYDANEQSTAAVAPSAAASASTADAYAYDDYDCLEDDETVARKRAKVEAAAPPKKSKPKLEKLTISGTWPSLSPCVRLDVTFKTINGAGGTKHEATDIVSYFDKSMSEEPRVTIGDFAMMLRHGAIIHPLQIQTVLNSLFPALVQAEEGATSVATGVGESPGTCVRTVLPPDDYTGKGVRPHINLYTVAVSELLEAIACSKQISLDRVFNHNSIFAGLAGMLLYPREIALIVEHYGPRRWQDIVARGPSLITRVYALMTRRPHVLCFTQLKFDECLAVQRALIDDARHTPHSSVQANARESPAANIQAAEEIARRCEAAVASVRWLAQMPELSMAGYVALTREHAWTLTLPVEQRPIVRVAIDIYSSIIQHDLFAGNTLFDDTRRHETNGRGASSGHVFSVFGNLYGQDVLRDRACDSGYSDGTLSLDAFFAAWEREQKAKRLAAAAAPKPTVIVPVATTKAAVKRKIVAEEIEDFLPARLPTDRPPALIMTTPPPPPVLTSAAPPTPAIGNEPPEPLNEDISRLSEVCTNYQFCTALRWLCEQNLLVSFKQTGTGPRNKGRSFDVFYTRDMWRTQVALCETLSDIYRRALTERLTPLERRVHVTKPSGAPYRVADLNADIAFREAARGHLRGIVRREELRQIELTDLRAELRAPRKDGLPSQTSKTRFEDLIRAALPLRQLRALHECVHEFIASSAPVMSSRHDAYEDMLSPIAHRIVPEDEATIEARLASSSLSDEQKDGIRHVLLNGVTVFMSPGGCGKTFAVQTITKFFSLDQIVVCALTGKACEVLQHQVGKVSTIHSLLLRETLHRQQLARHRAKLARWRAIADSARTASTLVTAEQTTEFIKLQTELEELVGCPVTRSPLANIRLLIVDETSLTDEVLIRRLLEFLHPMGEARKASAGDAALCRVLFLGDFNQLGSIEPGSLLQSLCRAFPHCVRMFTRNFRSAGATIFSLARGIVLRKRSVINDVDFDTRRNEARLRRSTVPANDSVEERAAAEDASVVFYTTNDRTLQSDLRRVLGLLGADVPPRSTHTVDADLLALRDGIHIIAPTNALASQCNTYCREMYFGREMPQLGGGDGLTPRYALPAPVMYFKALRADRVYFRRNLKIVTEVSAQALAEHAAYEAARLAPPASSTAAASSDADAAREQAVLLALTATSDAANADAADDEEVAPRACATKPGAEAIEALNARMEAIGSSPSTSNGMRRFVTRFYNSEILTLCDLYNVPRQPSVHTLCVCGLCPPLPAPRNMEEARARQREPPQPYPCVRWPHVVPERRCAIGDMSPSASIQYHDHALTSSNVAHTRRMAVFRTQAGTYKQLSVDADMSERSAWEYGWATTIHRYQGSGTRVVVIVVPRDSSFVDRSMLYTAVTRAEQRVVFMGSAETWRRVAQREPAQRRTELWFMLAQSLTEVHRRVAEACGIALDDPLALANALASSSPVERELLDTSRRLKATDARAVWALFDRSYAEAVQRAGLSEL